MESHMSHQQKLGTPAGIIAMPLSVFPTGKFMVECECSGRNFIPVRSLLRHQAQMSVGEVIEKFRCGKCGQPASTACLLSQIIIK